MWVPDRAAGRAGADVGDRAAVCGSARAGGSGDRPGTARPDGSINESTVAKRLLRLLTVGGWANRLGQVAGSIDQAHMREGLGEVTNQPFCLQIILLGEQTNIVA